MSQNSASSERMRFAPACCEKEKRRDGTVPLCWGRVFSGGVKLGPSVAVVSVLIHELVGGENCLPSLGRKRLGCFREKECFL